MNCPHCGSTAISRAARDLPEQYRSAKTVQGVIFRRHRCLDCKDLFTSVQKVLDRSTAEELEERLLPPASDEEAVCGAVYHDEDGISGICQKLPGHLSRKGDRGHGMWTTTTYSAGLAEEIAELVDYGGAQQVG